MLKRLSLVLNLPYASVSKGVKFISTFVAGQGLVQFLQLLSGFFLIRWLPVEEYAQYGVAFAFQSTAQALVEFGFSGAIVALVGNRVYDRKIIGNYIKAGQYYRNRFFILVAALCVIVFPIFTSIHHWPFFTTGLLLISILSNLYFSGNISFYTPPLLIHKKLGDKYLIEVKNGIFRIILLGALYLFSALNAWLAAFTTSILTITNGFAFKKKAARFVNEPKVAAFGHRKEMLAYLKPIMPGIIFTAFQGQIMVFIISIFGETNSIAEVAALGRLGQLFILLNVAGSTIVAPYFARHSEKGLLKKFLFTISIATLFAALIWLLSFCFPELLIFMIGPKYQHLQDQIPLLVFISCLAFLNDLMWSVIASRKWLWWWMPVLNIGGIVLIQVLCICYMDLSTTRGVLIFSLFIHVFTIVHKLIVSTYGFSRPSSTCTGRKVG